MPHDLDGFAYDPRNKDCSGTAELNLDSCAWSSWYKGVDGRGFKQGESDTCINVVIGGGGESPLISCVKKIGIVLSLGLLSTGGQVYRSVQTLDRTLCAHVRTHASAMTVAS